MKNFVKILINFGLSVFVSNAVLADDGPSLKELCEADSNHSRQEIGKRLLLGNYEVDGTEIHFFNAGDVDFVNEISDCTDLDPEDDDHEVLIPERLLVMESQWMFKDGIVTVIEGDFPTKLINKDEQPQSAGNRHFIQGAVIVKGDVGPNQILILDKGASLYVYGEINSTAQIHISQEGALVIANTLHNDSFYIDKSLPDSAYRIINDGKIKAGLPKTLGLFKGADGKGTAQEPDGP